MIGRGSETLWLDGIFEMRVAVTQGDVLDICCVHIEGEMVDRCVYEVWEGDEGSLCNCLVGEDLSRSLYPVRLFQREGQIESLPDR